MPASRHGDQAKTLDSSCVINGGKTSTGLGFSLAALVSPCHLSFH
jgi:hypothetical protein